MGVGVGVGAGVRGAAGIDLVSAQAGRSRAASTKAITNIILMKKPILRSLTFTSFACRHYLFMGEKLH